MACFDPQVSWEWLCRFQACAAQVLTCVYSHLWTSAKWPNEQFWVSLWDDRSIQPIAWKYPDMWGRQPTMWGMNESSQDQLTMVQTHRITWWPKLSWTLTTVVLTWFVKQWLVLSKSYLMIPFYNSNFSSQQPFPFPIFLCICSGVYIYIHFT